MKPFQIGLLVLVGALGGALIMKFTQRSKPAPAPIVAAAPGAPAAAPAPVDATKPTAFPDKTAAAPPAALPVRHAKPAGQPLPDGRGSVTAPHATEAAQNSPPTQPEPPAAPPAPVTVQEPSAPPIFSDPSVEPVAATVEPEASPTSQQLAPSVTLQAGMTLPVRLGESLSSEHNQAGDTFTATLDAPLSTGGFVIAEKGARVEGRIVEAQKSGVKTRATLALELTKLNTSDGQHVAIKTETLRKQAEAMATGDQVGIVAAAAGIGAIIGAMAGGGKGAAIGAGAGGAAGGGGVVATRNKAVLLPTETKVAFRLGAPVTITERLNQ
jgi:hypothetical protein